MGAINVKHTGSGAAIALSSDGTSLLLDGTAIGGGGADLYAANESSPTAQPSATGTNAVAIGDSAIASDSNSLAGPFSRSAGSHSVALGIANNSSSYGAGGSYSISVGYQSRAMALQSVALGAGAYVDSDSSRGLALGENAYVQQCDYGTALGAAARVYGGNTATEATAIGSSYASGTASFAAAIADNTSSYGATNANSVAIGYRAKASGQHSLSLGYASQATGLYSIAIGDTNTTAREAVGIGENNSVGGMRSTVIGYNSIGTAAYSTTFGRQANDQGIISRFAFSGGSYSSQGDMQQGMFPLRMLTTDATATALTTDIAAASTDNQIILPNNSAYAFSGTIIARQQAADGSDYASWEIKGALLRDANAASTVLGNGIVNKLFASSGASAWAIALTADTTNGGLKVEATGAAATDIKWIATINTSEVTYA